MRVWKREGEKSIKTGGCANFTLEGKDKHVNMVLGCMVHLTHPLNFDSLSPSLPLSLPPSLSLSLMDMVSHPHTSPILVCQTTLIYLHESY
jgi:hypothetical protein